MESKSFCRNWASATIVAVGVLTWVTAANAVVIISTAKLGVVSDPNALSVGGADLQAITPHSLWAPNGSAGRGEVWVSNADTGFDGTEFQPRAFTNDADLDVIFRVTESFSVVGASTLSLSVWADDTARVWLDGVLLQDWNPTQNVCADGIIGCEPGENFFVAAQPLISGDHLIWIDTYQIGDWDEHQQ